MCEWCGNEFEAQKCSTRYCSKRCAEHAYKERKRQEKKKRVENHEIERVAAEGEDKLKDSQYLTVAEAAKILKRTRFGIYKLIYRGVWIWCYNLNQENTHLHKVEWLYRYERVSYDADGIRNMMLREEAMMVGDNQEQDSIKTMTIQLERRKRAERTHVYFRPSDSWTPESGNLLW